ncbi:MAG TPA: extracellular solute-binding protein, partial [Atribacteraceae bacterium]|nr:extracellular solute-binding protein [Atribacteraceae bacterium]
MKKVLTVSLVALLSMVFLLAVSAGAEDFGWLKNWEGVTLTLSSHTGPTTDAYKVIAQEFEELTGARVVIIDESWKDLLVKHLASFVAGTGEFDILTFPYIWFGHYAEGMMVENLDEWFAREDLLDPNYDMGDFVPAILEAYGRYTAGFTPDPEALWSVPYKFDVYLAQYRTDMFADAGIVDADGLAKGPETWDELLDSAQKLAEIFPDISPLAFPLAISDPMVATFVPMLASYGGEVPSVIYDENVYPRFQGPEGIAAVSMLKDLLPFMPPDALAFDYDMVNAQMSQGMAAYAINWNAYLPVLLDPERSLIHENVAFALTPGGPAGRYQGL